MNLFYILLFCSLGLAVGSFVGALSYRLPRGISVASGRSRCPTCKHMIAWYDNIPLLSYLFLNGKCRNCKKKISPRYFLIELSFLVLFLFTYYFSAPMISNSFFLTKTDLVTGALPFFLLIFGICATIFVIDLEHQIIPDSLNYALLILVLLGLLFFGNTLVFKYLLAGLTASLFLLLVNLFTRGRGMGLGDVKFALPAGILLGFPNVFVWLLLSFVSGAVTGVFLILIGKAKLGRHIPFGPFLVISLIMTLIFGNMITGVLF